MSLLELTPSLSEVNREPKRVRSPNEQAFLKAREATPPTPRSAFAATVVTALRSRASKGPGRPVQPHQEPVWPPRAPSQLRPEGRWGGLGRSAGPRTLAGSNFARPPSPRNAAFSKDPPVPNLNVIPRSAAGGASGARPTPSSPSTFF